MRILEPPALRRIQAQLRALPGGHRKSSRRVAVVRGLLPQIHPTVQLVTRVYRRPTTGAVPLHLIAGHRELKTVPLVVHVLVPAHVPPQVARARPKRRGPLPHVVEPTAGLDGQADGLAGLDGHGPALGGVALVAAILPDVLPATELVVAVVGGPPAGAVGLGVPDALRGQGLDNLPVATRRPRSQLRHQRHGHRRMALRGPGIMLSNHLLLFFIVLLLRRRRRRRRGRRRGGRRRRRRRRLRRRFAVPEAGAILAGLRGPRPHVAALGLVAGVRVQDVAPRGVVPVHGTMLAGLGAAGALAGAGGGVGAGLQLEQAVPVLLPGVPLHDMAVPGKISGEIPVSMPTQVARPAPVGMLAVTRVAEAGAVRHAEAQLLTLIH
mmetsp:Transcript_55447/g.118957  ORF Transcript_55447/g.118957 Transcript_55447/m.118957 type:complete len:380 (-) Transcript_55447:366-1505(-)